MDADTQPRRAIDRAVVHLLQPLFRLLLRHGVSYRAFEALARRCFVSVALDEFGIPGRKASISRTAILSGLTRKEVQRLASESDGACSVAVEQHNRAARVLTGWVRDADFHGPEGAPRALKPDGPGGFAELVRRHSGDVPARAVMDELLQVGAVRRLDDGRYELLERGYVPRGSPAEKLRILGTDVADLISTIDHNLQHGSSDPRFQRKVVYEDVPAEVLPAFRRLGTAQSQALLEKLDRWLAEHHTVEPNADAQQARVRVGVGIYYFEQPPGSAGHDGAQP